MRNSSVTGHRRVGSQWFEDAGEGASGAGGGHRGAGSGGAGRAVRGGVVAGGVDVATDRAVGGGNREKPGVGEDAVDVRSVGEWPCEHATHETLAGSSQWASP